MSRAGRGKIALLMPAMALVWIFFILPLGMALYQSFRLDGRWSVKNYADLFDVPFSRSIDGTLWISALTTVITILIAIPACSFVARRGGLFGKIFFAGMALAFTLSVLTRTLAWQILLTRNGFINTVLKRTGLIEAPLDLLYTRGAVLAAMVQVFIPIAAMVLYAGMRGIDRSLLMASRTLGANPLQAFAHAYWPQFKGSLVMAALVVFAGCIGSFVVPSVLGGPDDTMFGQLMNNALVNDVANGAARASAAGVLTFLFLTAVLLAGLWLIRGKEGSAAPALMGGIAGQRDVT